VERLDLVQVHNLVDAPTHLATLRDMEKRRPSRYLACPLSAGAHANLGKNHPAGDIDFVQ